MKAKQFKLTDAESKSALWMKLEAHLQERLSEKRRHNDGDLTTEQTSKLRGRIAELKYLSGLGKPGLTLEGDDDSQG